MYIVDTELAKKWHKKKRVNPDVVPVEWFQYALQTEIDSLTLLLSTGKLVLIENADLAEVAAEYVCYKISRYPDWYDRLKKAEDGAIREWRNFEEVGDK